MSSAFSSGECALAICDRCKMPIPYKELRKDGNVPGLYVCGRDGCYDVYDPYRMKPRTPDAFTLRHPRPMSHPVPVFSNITPPTTYNVSQAKEGIPIPATTLGSSPSSATVNQTPATYVTRVVDAGSEVIFQETDEETYIPNNFNVF